MLKEVSKILDSLKLKPSDLRIYNLLLAKNELSVREIAKELNLSTRFVRERLKELHKRGRLKELHKRGIVKRRVIENGWIGYVYRAEDPKVMM
ncbi:MAG: hypothetical protein PWQ22_1519 [Archaeoglobaceae archaeon]|nr:hypothetical protein [Archaeoglobaceae archaeon]